MQGTKAPKRYAKALLNFSVERKSEDLVFEQVTELLDAISHQVEFQRLLVSPIVKTAFKKEALEKIYPDKNSVMREFVEVLARNKRLSLLVAICKSYVNQYYIYKKRQIAVVTTAVEISDQLKDKFLKKIVQLTGNDNVVLQNRVEPEIIGGFILRIGDLQYNDSVLNKFSLIEKNFKDNLFSNL